MDFDELEAKEEEAGPEFHVITSACLDPTWQEFLRRREEEQTRTELEEAQERAARKQRICNEANDDWENFMMEKYNEWERWRSEERRRRRTPEEPEAMSSWEEFMKSNPNMFRGVYAGGTAQIAENGCWHETVQEQYAEELEDGIAKHSAWCSSTTSSADGAGSIVEEVSGTVPAGVARAQQDVRQHGGSLGILGPTQRRRGAFSASLHSGAVEEPKAAGALDLERDSQPTRPEQHAEVEPDPTGLRPEDPTFAFVRRMIDTNRGEKKEERQLAKLREQWKADIEEGRPVPSLAKVLQHIEEDERGDPDRQEEVLALENVLEKIDLEEKEEAEWEEVKEFLPDVRRERQETTLALGPSRREVPLAIPAIRVLQETYQDWDMSTRDALESFEVSLSTYQPADEGYISTVATMRAEAAAGEREWMAWKAKDDFRRRMKREGLAPVLPAAPKNSKISRTTAKASKEGDLADRCVGGGVNKSKQGNHPREKAG